MTSDNDESDDLVVSDKDIMFAAVIGTALKKDAEDGKQLDIKKMNQPGTVVWTDPSSGETRYSSPGDRMYSLSLMYATGIVQDDGTIQDLT